MIKVVGVNFKENGRIYYFDPNNLKLKKNFNVIVETEKGLQFGSIVEEFKNVSKKEYEKKMKKVIRIASKNDIEKNNKNILDSKKALIDCKKIIKKFNLKMKLIDVNYTFDRKQMFFNFISDERVDFRKLVKELAGIYKCRIELRQVGIRDRAREIGGIGPCGLILCCNRYLYSFDSVSIKMAKNQNLSLNPNKINGVCGRLLCCLKYENDNYTKIKSDFKKVGSFVTTEYGEGKIIGIDIFKKKYKIYVKNHGIIELEKEDIDGSN